MIFLTGATGFIGKNFVEEFFKHDIPCKCLVRIDSVVIFESFLTALEVKYKKKNIHIEMVAGSLFQPETFKASLCNVQMIIHCAAVVYAECAETFQIVNVLATQALVAYTKEYGIRKFVFLSSAAVLFSAQGHYTHSKRIAEKKIKEQFTNTNVDYLILRLSLVTGPYDNKNIAQIIQVMLRYRVALMIGRGANKIQPLYVKDIIDVTLHFWRQRIPMCQAITLAPDDCLLYRDFLFELSQAIKSKTGKHIFILSAPLFLMRWGVTILSCFLRRSNVSMETLDRILNHTQLENHEAKRVCGFVPTPPHIGLVRSVDFFVTHKDV